MGAICGRSGDKKIGRGNSPAYSRYRFYGLELKQGWLFGLLVCGCLATHPWQLTMLAKCQGQWLILIGEENSGSAPVGLGDYPDGRYSVLWEAVIVIGR